MLTFNIVEYCIVMWLYIASCMYAYMYSYHDCRAQIDIVFYNYIAKLLHQFLKIINSYIAS